MPGKPKGLPKTGGRQLGTPNKRQSGVAEILEAKGINLIDFILKKLPLLDEPEQIKAASALLPYVYPKLTSTELKTAEGFQIQIVDYIAKDK